MNPFSSERSADVRIWASLVTIYVVWGSTFAAIDLAVRTVPPFLAMSMRHLVAGALLLAWGLYRTPGEQMAGARSWLPRSSAAPSSWAATARSRGPSSASPPASPRSSSRPSRCGSCCFAACSGSGSGARRRCGSRSASRASPCCCVDRRGGGDDRADRRDASWRSSPPRSAWASGSFASTRGTRALPKAPDHRRGPRVQLAGRRCSRAWSPALLGGRGLGRCDAAAVSGESVGGARLPGRRRLADRR